jgi:hypothetical protein
LENFELLQNGEDIQILSGLRECYPSHSTLHNEYVKLKELEERQGQEGISDSP